MLKYILFVMREHKGVWKPYAEQLIADGICCLEQSSENSCNRADFSGNESVGKWNCGKISTDSVIFAGTICTAEDTLVITDDETTAETCRQDGIACIGYCPDEQVYFPHVRQVWESFEGMEKCSIEQFFNRFHHLPVVIARTGRIVLRESMPGDFETLHRMGREAGWNLDILETEEQFLAYLRYAYSFYGYGYWTAELAGTGEIVGWCGFCGWGMHTEHPEDIYMQLENLTVHPEQTRLELGYLVDKVYRRCGLAYEMCRAALGYAFETLDADEIWVRIASDNTASLRLAEKLGFRTAKLGIQVQKCT